MEMLKKGVNYEFVLDFNGSYDLEIHLEYIKNLQRGTPKPPVVFVWLFGAVSSL